MHLENSMFKLKYLDENLNDMGLTRIYLDPNVLFEELVVYNRILTSMQENFFLEYDNNNIMTYIDEIEHIPYIEIIEGIHIIEDDDEMPALVAPAATLAAFAHDAQNIHTAPAQSETARAIQVLMNPLPESWKTLFEEWLIITGKTSDGNEHIMNNLLEEFFVGIPPYDGFITYLSFQDIFCELWSYAKKQTSEIQLTIATEILTVVTHVFNKHHRLDEMARIICKYIPEFNTISTSWLNYWIDHRYDTLLHSIRKLWFDILEMPLPRWTEVLHESLWNEFKMDVYNTHDFNTQYSELLRRIWDYASAQPPDTKAAIAIRLAEEIIDGEGMCSQGKLSRLANVLRGFHPGLEAIPVLSTQEQLQSRIAVISRLPHGERAAAAAAVFAELHIAESAQREWLEALLEA
jgi:hypothetical protein